MIKRLAATMIAATASPATIADSAETVEVFGSAAGLTVGLSLGVGVVVVVGVGVGEVDAAAQAAVAFTLELFVLKTSPEDALPPLALPVTLAEPLSPFW